MLARAVRDEEGRPAAVVLRGRRADVFGGRLPERAAPLADVTWPLTRRPTEAEWERAVARTGAAWQDRVVGHPALPEELEPLASRDAFSA